MMRVYTIDAMEIIGFDFSRAAPWGTVIGSTPPPTTPPAGIHLRVTAGLVRRCGGVGAWLTTISSAILYCNFVETISQITYAGADQKNVIAVS